MIEDREGQCYIRVRTWNLYVGKLHRIYVAMSESDIENNSGRAWAWDWFWQLERGVRSEDAQRAV
jgi:hypothetical protein